MNHHDDKHAIELPYITKTFWNDNAAAGQKGPFNRIAVRVPGYWQEVCFEMPRQSHDLDRFEHMLAAAFERGISHNKKEISATLKAVIGL